MIITERMDANANILRKEIEVNDIWDRIIETVLENAECEINDICRGCEINASAFPFIEDKEKVKNLIKGILEDSEEIKTRG